MKTVELFAKSFLFFEDEYLRAATEYVDDRGAEIDADKPMKAAEKFYKHWRLEPLTFKDPYLITPERERVSAASIYTDPRFGSRDPKAETVEAFKYDFRLPFSGTPELLAHYPQDHPPAGRLSVDERHANELGYLVFSLNETDEQAFVMAKAEFERIKVAADAQAAFIEQYNERLRQGIEARTLELASRKDRLEGLAGKHNIELK